MEMSNDTLNLSDHYVELLEKVVEENRQLREEIRSQGRKQEKVLNDFSFRLNELAVPSTSEATKSRKNRRSKSQQIAVPQLCRQAYRTIYNRLKKGGNFEGYVLTESYGAKENQDAVEKVIQAVEIDNGGNDKCPWTHAQLKAAGASYYKTKRDAHTRAQKNATDEHRMVCRRQGRMRDKLQRRLVTLENVNCSTEKKDKYREALKIEYTSSDESDISEDEDGQLRLRGYLTKKLPWERTSLRKTKELLDQRYFESLSMRSKRSIFPRRNHTMSSTRPAPNNPVEWAVRQAVANLKTSTPF